MAISKKNEYLLAAVTAGLALSNVSAGNNTEGYTSPNAKFFSAENRSFSIDCNLEQNLLEAKNAV